MDRCEKNQGKHTSLVELDNVGVDAERLEQRLSRGAKGTCRLGEDNCVARTASKVSESRALTQVGSRKRRLGDLETVSVITYPQGCSQCTG